MDWFTILASLLKKLRREQDRCPYCDGEKAHRGECVLRGLWFIEELVDLHRRSKL